MAGEVHAGVLGVFKFAHLAAEVEKVIETEHLADDVRRGVVLLIQLKGELLQARKTEQELEALIGSDVDKLKEALGL